MERFALVARSGKSAGDKLVGGVLTCRIIHLGDAVAVWLRYHLADAKR